MVCMRMQHQLCEGSYTDGDYIDAGIGYSSILNALHAVVKPYDTG
jgi:hypothetical protein